MGYKTKLRDEISRWLMRVTQAGVPIKIALLGVTASSTLTTAIKNTFLEPYTIHILSVFVLSSLIFAWAYDRFSVLNIQMKHDADRTSNFIGPQMAINQRIRGLQLAAAMEAVAEDKDVDVKVIDETEEALEKYRDGIDIKSLDN